VADGQRVRRPARCCWNSTRRPPRPTARATPNDLVSAAALSAARAAALLGGGRLVADRTVTGAAAGTVPAERRAAGAADSSTASTASISARLAAHRRRHRPPGGGVACRPSESGAQARADGADRPSTVHGFQEAGRAEFHFATRLPGEGAGCASSRKAIWQRRRSRLNGTGCCACRGPGSTRRRRLPRRGGWLSTTLNEGEQKASTFHQELVKAESRGKLMTLEGTGRWHSPATGGPHCRRRGDAGPSTNGDCALKDNPLEVEAFIDNKDIGFVNAGQEAQ
jgi:hypothetical protein